MSSLVVLLLVFLGGELERQASLDVAFLVSQTERNVKRRVELRGLVGEGPGNRSNGPCVGLWEWTELS